MNCKKCGMPLTVNDQFCKNCGTLTKEENIQQNNNGVNASINQASYIQTPSQPVPPTAPVQPSQPVPPTAPVQPSQPVPPIAPVQPSQPVPPIVPSQPSQPVPPIAPVQPSQPVPPIAPVQPSQLGTSNTVGSTIKPNLMASQSSIEDGKPNLMESQQSFNNMNSSTSQSEYNQIQPKSTKKNKGNKFIILGVVVAVVIVSAVLLLVNLLGGKESNGGTSGSPVVSKSTYKVKYNGFTFDVPDNLIYQEQSGMLLLGDENETWAASIQIEQGNFAQMKTNKSQLQGLMQKNQYTASAAKEKTYGGMEFITLELSKNGGNLLVAFAKANSMNILCIQIGHLDNDFDYKILELLVPVFKSATYTGTSSSIKIESDLDMGQFSELAK